MAAQPQQQPETKPAPVASPVVSASGSAQPPSTPQIVSDIPRPPPPEPPAPAHSQSNAGNMNNHPAPAPAPAVNNAPRHEQSAPGPPTYDRRVGMQTAPRQVPQLLGSVSRGPPPPPAGYTGYFQGPPQHGLPQHNPPHQGPPQQGPPQQGPPQQAPPQVGPPANSQAAPPGQGQWRANIDHNAAMRRPVIVDPPRRQQVDAPVDGFASPEHDHARENPRFLEDRHRLAFAIDQSVPSAVRRVIRDNWEKCLLGSDFHQAFVTNATIHHVTPAIFQRAVRDFGNKMVGYGKRELIEHFSMYDLEELSDHILSKVSNSFLDKAMAMRLKTIEAKPLINALARAERLGYEPSDIVEETPTSGTYPRENVRSGQPVPAAPAVPQNSQVLSCELCGHVFPGPAAKEHHVKKMVCSRQSKTPGGFKFSCQYCGQGFSTIVGLQYHTANKVCGDYHQQSTGVGTRNNPVALSSGNNTPIHSGPAIPAVPEPPQSQGSTSGYKEWSIAQRAAEKVQTTPGPRPSQPELQFRSVTPSSTPGGTPGDPYAHLNPAQMAAMQEELRQAEIKYGDKLRQAQAIVDDAERKTRIDALSNSYGTKQSMIRKKYGVRLRTRRTKAEIEAEKERISATKEGSLSRVVLQTRSSPVAGEKRPQSAWTAANVGTPPNDYTNGHDAKRQRFAQEALAQGAIQYNTQHPPPNHLDTPSREPRSTTAIPPPTIPSSQDASMRDGHIRAGGSESSARNSASLQAASASGSPSKSATPGASAPNSVAPEQVASDTIADQAIVKGEASDSGSDSNNDDIPASLPASVRQSLPAQPPPRAGSRPSSS